LVLYPTLTGRGDAVVPIGILALALVLFTVFHPGLRPVRDEADETADEAASPNGKGAGDDKDGSLAAAEAHH
jgi:hypothetical protein